MLIVVILLAAFIVVPLVDLTLNERTAVKIAVYLITFVYVLLMLLRGGLPV